MKHFLVVLLVWASFVGAADEQNVYKITGPDVVIKWAPNSEDDLAGYRAYFSYDSPDAELISFPEDSALVLDHSFQGAIYDSSSGTWTLNFVRNQGRYVIPDTLTTFNLLEIWPDADFYKKVFIKVTALDKTGNESSFSETVSAIFSRAKVTPGDANFDKRITIKDADLTSKSLGAEPGHFWYNPVCDYNADRKVTIRDLDFCMSRAGYEYN